jgi:lantibiotic modifying enzyme
MPVIDTLDVCRSIAKKIKHLESFEETHEWESITLSQGYPGLICLFSELNAIFPNEGWDSQTHACIEKLINEIKQWGIHNSSLFSGTAGICFAVNVAAQQTGNYSNLNNSLHTQLLKDIRTHYLKPLQKVREEKKGVSPQLYDVISGVAGILPYLLVKANQRETHSIILELLAELVSLTQPIVIEDKQLPGWFIAERHLNNGENFSDGCLDTGLAHGIAGVLCVLAKATLKGINVSGQLTSMRTITSWLESLQSNVGPFQKIWPSRFSVNYKPQRQYDDALTLCRDGWCYGAPGVAFALFMASCAMKDKELYTYAIDAMLNACVRLNSDNTLKCPSFCHGGAGVLAIIHQMYLATKMSIFSHTTDHLLMNILRKYDEKHPLGFKTYVAEGPTEEKAVNSLSIIQGTPGVLLSLLFHQSKTLPPWLPIFLLG